MHGQHRALEAKCEADRREQQHHLPPLTIHYLTIERVFQYRTFFRMWIRFDNGRHKDGEGDQDQNEDDYSHDRD